MIINSKEITIDEIKKIYYQPIFELIGQAQKIHVLNHHPQEIQVCQLINIKEGGCKEDCKYCTQSSYYKTNTSPKPLMSLEDVLEIAKKAIEKGASRVCLGAAIREVVDNKQFEDILKMIKELKELGVEVCATLGLLKENQALKLKEAGLFAYNHNLDTSESFYPSIITTRSYQDRLNTLDIVGKIGLSTCCGGIIGLGETIDDRLELLSTLANRQPVPDSVPINRLTPMKGTPLENQKIVSIWDLIRLIATTRIIIPKTMIRLASGRQHMSKEEHALCFLSGANSIFSGDFLLTKNCSNPSLSEDAEMFQLFGLQKKQAFA